jgi:hypothetical protein
MNLVARSMVVHPQPITLRWQSFGSSMDTKMVGKDIEK